MSLLACPFCRSLYTQGEASVCPECGLELTPWVGLSPPAYDPEGVPEPAEHRLIAWTDGRRGRGALLLFGLLGLAAFFLPWVELTFPDHELRSGFDLARGRLGWLWGGAVGWFVLVPLVLTRRTIAAMRGVRAITAVFSALTLGEVLVLLALPPTPPQAVPMTFEWSYGLLLSAIISAAATATAFRLGGPLPAAQNPSPHESSEGRTLH